MSNHTPTENSSDTPKSLTYFGVITGFALIVVGLAIIKIDPLAWRLALCVGLGLILAAFGTRANAKYRGWTVTGAGAVAIILFGLLLQAGDQKENRLAKLNILGGFHQNTSLVAMQGVVGRIGGGWVSQNRKHFFQIFEDEFLIGGCFTFDVYADKNGNNQTVDPGEEDTVELPTHLIEKSLTSKQSFDFFYDHTKPGKIWLSQNDANNNGTPIATGRNCPVSTPENAASDNKSWWQILIGDALAGEPPPEELAKQLGSTDPYERRNARRALARAGERAIAPLIKTFEKNSGEYRYQIGVTDALARMLSSRQVPKETISNALNDQLFSSLLKQVDHPDSTLQSISVNLFENLQDPRSGKLLLEIIRLPSSKNGQLFAAQLMAELYPGMSPQQKSSVFEELKNLPSDLGEAAAAAISEITATSGSLNENPSAWAYAGLNFGKGWDQSSHYFQESGLPQLDDTLTASGDVTIRSGPIEYKQEFRVKILLIISDSGFFH